jgi:predicted nucleic acid-binding Zn ribbon protein
MPTYVYKFVDTGETLEVQQAFTDDALTEAVHPGSGATMAVKKVFQPVGVTFKGGGFYKTDSRGSAGATSSSGSTTAPGSAPSTAAGTAPATSSEGSGSSASTSPTSPASTSTSTSSSTSTSKSD